MYVDNDDNDDNYDDRCFGDDDNDCDYFGLFQ